MKNQNSEGMEERRLSQDKFGVKESYDLINCQRKQVVEKTSRGRVLIVSKFIEEE